MGTRRRGLPALGAFDHADGTGHVAAHRGDYYDAIENRKARVHLVVFEAGLGGLLPYGARRLRRNARAAKESGADPTDYTISPTARSFVLHAAPLGGLRAQRGERHPKVAQAQDGQPPPGAGGRVRGPCPLRESRVRGHGLRGIVCVV